MGMRAWPVALALTLVLAVQADGESVVVPLSGPGIVKADLDLALYEITDCIPAACPTVDISAVTVTELANGRDYLIAGLPDVTAGDGLTYELCWDDGDTRYRLSWPTSTRTPITTEAGITYQVPSAVVIAAGDTLTVPKVEVAGLPADPSGATVIFLLESLAGTTVLTGSGDIVDLKAGSDGTWMATLRYAWEAGDTDDLSGQYSGRFRVTYPAGGVQTVPPAPGALAVRVHP